MLPGDRSNQCPRGFTLVSAGPYCAGNDYYYAAPGIMRIVMKHLTEKVHFKIITVGYLKALNT